MLVVAPDFDRRIDLPGAGPCPRPVDVDRRKAELKQLVSLRVYSFASGVEIDGEAEGDEVFIVLMRGAADFAIEQDGVRAGDFRLRMDGARAIYMPPHASYHLHAVANCDIAYARCHPVGEARPVLGFAAAGGRVVVADHAGGMELSLATEPPGRHSLAAADGGSRERFVHVRSDAGALRLGGEPIGDWGSAILLDGERTILEIEGNPVDLLLISATAR